MPLRLQMHFRRQRCLIRRIDTREVLELARLRPRVKPLRVTLDAFFDGGIDEHFHELAGREQLAHHLALGTERRDERT